MPVSVEFGTVLHSLIVLTAPEYPSHVGQGSRTGLVAAEDMGDNLAMISGVGKASCDCRTLCVDALVAGLRGVIVSIGDVCAVPLPIIISTSTGADNVVGLMYNTNRSFEIKATISIRAVSICGSELGALLLLRFSAGIQDGTSITKDGTDISDITTICCDTVHVFCVVVTLYIVSIGLRLVPALPVSLTCVSLSRPSAALMLSVQATAPFCSVSAYVKSSHC